MFLRQHHLLHTSPREDRSVFAYEVRSELAVTAMADDAAEIAATIGATRMSAQRKIQTKRRGGLSQSDAPSLQRSLRLSLRSRKKTMLLPSMATKPTDDVSRVAKTVVVVAKVRVILAPPAPASAKRNQTTKTLPRLRLQSVNPPQRPLPTASDSRCGTAMYNANRNRRDRAP